MKFRQIFSGVLFKFLHARAAAEFQFLALIDDALFVAHGAKIIARDETGFQRIRFGPSTAGAGRARIASAGAGTEEECNHCGQRERNCGVQQRRKVSISFHSRRGIN